MHTHLSVESGNVCNRAWSGLHLPCLIVLNNVFLTATKTRAHTYTLPKQVYTHFSLFLSPSLPFSLSLSLPSLSLSLSLSFSLFLSLFLTHTLSHSLSLSPQHNMYPGDANILPLFSASLPRHLPRPLQERLSSRQHQGRVSQPPLFTRIKTSFYLISLVPWAADHSNGGVQDVPTTHIGCLCTGRWGDQLFGCVERWECSSPLPGPDTTFPASSSARHCL